MAQTIFGLNQDALCVLGLLSVLLVIQKGDSFQFTVGGPRGTWTVPSDPNAATYNQWAEHNRFQIGDTLLFVYNADQDSVLYVTKYDYANCNTESPLQRFTDGHTVFRLNHSGPHYFISGAAQNCQKNEKMIVVVLADRSNHGSSGTGSSPPQSPAEEVPPPAPSEEAPSPPSGMDQNPTQSPSQESSPPRNGASSIITGFFGTIAAFVGSSLVLVI